MKRLAGAWVVGLFCVMLVGVWGGGAGSWAQETGTPGADAERLLTQVADSQRAQDALLAELAAAHASDLAAAAATTTALTAEITALEATRSAQAGEISTLQTQVAELEAAMPTPATPVPLVEVGLNEVAQAGPWDFRVSSVERQESLEVPGGEPANPQGVFLLVTLNVINTGTEDQTYDPTWFQVTDDRGRGWTFDFTMTDTLALAGAGARQYGAISPGLPTEAVVIFDVPPDATGLTLGVAEDLGATSEPQPDPFAIRLEE
jgi:Domain of unknown function (DUF4352)